MFLPAAKAQITARVPAKPFQAGRAAAASVNRRLNAGTAVHCPTCEGDFRRYLAGPAPEKRPNVRCPSCGSLERHRARMMYLRQETDVFTRPQRMLHIAPEFGIAQQLAKIPTLDYVTGDLKSPYANHKIDATSIPFPDDSFDVVQCSHALEHIPDDRKAIAEFFRVLKPGGWAWLEAPYDPNRSCSYEDPGIISPAGREKAYGQWDHVRIYGTDLFSRLEEAGFAVAFVKVDAGNDTDRFGFIPAEFPVCRKV